MDSEYCTEVTLQTVHEKEHEHCHSRLTERSQSPQMATNTSPNFSRDTYH